MSIEPCICKIAPVYYHPNVCDSEYLFMKGEFVGKIGVLGFFTSIGVVVVVDSVVS